MQCKSDMSPHKIPRSIKCCSDRDLCNLELKPYYISQYSAPGAGMYYFLLVFHLIYSHIPRLKKNNRIVAPSSSFLKLLMIDYPLF